MKKLFIIGSTLLSLTCIVVGIRIYKKRKNKLDDIYAILNDLKNRVDELDYIGIDPNEIDITIEEIETV